MRMFYVVDEQTESRKTRRLIPVRIANPPKALMQKFSKKETEFYFKYADLVTTALMMPEVQAFIEFVAKKETLDIEKIKDVRVMVFPFGSTEFEQKYAKYREMNNELGCIGTWNEMRGIISIYPIMTNPPPSAIQVLEDETVVCFIATKAITALLEEILHTKYNQEYMKGKNLTRDELEMKVRKLADGYFDEFVGSIEDGS